MSQTAIARAVQAGLVTEVGTIRIRLDNDCVVEAKRYDVGDEVHLEIDCNNGLLRSIFGNVEVDGNVHVKTDRATLGRLITAAEASGMVPRLSAFVRSEVQSLKRGMPLLR